MNRLTFIGIALTSFLTLSAQNWEDSKTVKEQLMAVGSQGKAYYSQYHIYNPTKSDSTASPYTRTLAVKPYIYAMDFHYASGTWKTGPSVVQTRENLIRIVKAAWRENRAIPSFSWHLENPYVPSTFSGSAGFRYVHHKSVPDYPREHRSVIAEILKGTGNACGAGNSAGVDNQNTYPNPRAWFVDRCQEVAAIINELVDDSGRPIPLIFRLWHEWEDSWAWWGADYTSAKAYKKFYILTEQLIQKYAPQAQILWAYCPDRYWNSEQELMSRYPGDAYVDIIGFDDYELGMSEKYLQAAIHRARIVSQVAKKRHLAAALFETNNNKHHIPEFYASYLNRLLTADSVNLGIVQIWSLKDFNDATDMKTFLNSDHIIVEKIVRR